MDTLAQLQAIDQTTLTPLVRQALRRDSATPINWQVSPFGDGGGQCVYRFMGSAQDRGAIIPWSLVVKVARANAYDDPAAARYWKRELLAYQSGLLADLPAGLRAPRCFGVLEQSSGEGWLWLEEIPDAAVGRWPPERFLTVARQLGKFNAAYLTERPLPSYPWLSQGWFRSHLQGCTADVAQLPALRDHPFLRVALPGATADRILQLWDARDRLCDVLDQLPQTFCHLDLNPRNLFVRELGNGQIECVAIDWEFAGVSALGAELASLVGGSLVFDLADLDAADLEAGVFTSYLAGLQETGWSGDQRLVRLGYTISMGLHIIFVMLWALEEGTRNEGFRQWGEQMLRRPYAEILARSARLLEFLLARTDEAQQALRSV